MFFPLHDDNNEPVRQTPWLVYSLLAINVLVFCGDRLYKMASVSGYLRYVFGHGLVPLAWTDHLLTYAPVLTQHTRVPPELFVHNSFVGLWLMPVTYMFMHVNILHVLGNMWFLWVFADNLEERMGRAAFLSFYLLAGIGGGLLHVAFDPTSMRPLLGSSGAVAGVLGAYVILYPRNRITCYFCPAWFFIRRIDVHAWIVLGFFLLAQVIALSPSYVTNERTAFVCHLGGFLTGLLIGLPFRRHHRTLPVPAAPGPSERS